MGGFTGPSVGGFTGPSVGGVAGPSGYPPSGTSRYFLQDMGNLPLGSEPPLVPQVYIFWVALQPHLGLPLQSLLILALFWQ